MTCTPTESKAYGACLSVRFLGAFHKFSVRRLDAYLQEQEFRINNRDNQHAFCDVMKRIVRKEALRYQALTA